MTAFIDSPVVDEPDYQIARSLRFRRSASSYLSRTFGAPTDNRKFTLSAWVKKAAIGTDFVDMSLLSVSGLNGMIGLSGNATAFNGTYESRLFLRNGGVQGDYWLPLFRDATAWTHIVVAIDSTQSVQADRAKAWSNGVLLDKGLSVISLNSTFNLNAVNILHLVGAASIAANYYPDGYLAEYNFVDGQALTPAAFGRISGNSGQWVAKRYRGTYGNNGFYLDFNDPTSLASLGFDDSNPFYSVNLRSLGTNIGTYTVNGGLAAAFDGNINQPNAASARATTPAAGYNTAVIGKDWGFGVTKTITAFRMYSQNDGGFVGGTAAASAYKLQGSADGITYTDLFTGATTGATSEAVIVTSGIVTITAYRFHRINFNANGLDNHYVTELEFYEVGVIGLNHWTTSGVSLTEGSTYDSMLDVPLGGGWGDRGNYCTWNAAQQSLVFNGSVARTDGNLVSTDGGTTYGLSSIGTMAVGTGKWYWEITLTTASIYANIGVVAVNQPLTASTHTGIIYSQATGNKSNLNNCFGSGGSGSAYGATYASGNIIGTALDMDAGTIEFFKNGVSQGVAYSNLAGGTYTPAVGDGENAVTYSFTLNCGQRPFAYTPPGGFRKLHTGNLPSPPVRQPNKHFDTSIYAGTGITRSVTNAGFRPDLVWLKARSIAYNHYLTDSVRGSNVLLQSNLTSAEVSSTNVVTAFNSDGFSLGTDSVANQSAQTFVAWQWKAGGPAVTNTVGTITSQVSANPAAGFSVVTYPGNGISGATVGHGLGIAPGLIIQKRRNVDNAWRVWHKDLSTGRVLYLASTAAETLETAAFNGGGPTASTVVLGSGGDTNLGLGLLYCFAEIPGYSKIGSYTGNGSADGPFVFCGFRPRFLLIKRMGGAGTNWIIYDTYRDTHNSAGLELMANTSATELDARPDLDILSTGFKLREANPEFNSSDTYIFYAVAETPFKYALAR